MSKVFHTSVMLNEVVDALRCRPDGTYVDATLGVGGHAGEILRRSHPNGRVIGFEWDEEAAQIARRRLKHFHDRVIIVQDNFKNIRAILQKLAIPQIDGVLLDLGVSSLQLDHAPRGFSFTQEGPLDMRMNRRSPLTAADLVQRWSKDELERLLKDVGEGRWSKRIALALKEGVKGGEVTTTTELAQKVSKAIPSRYHPRKIHPATKTFLALRIAVNEELDNLRLFFKEGIECLKPGARLCVISFHSLEDRITKEAFRQYAKGCICPPDVPVCCCGQKPQLKILTPKPISPDAEEVRLNPRPRSARLRVAERLAS